MELFPILNIVIFPPRAHLPLRCSPHLHHIRGMQMITFFPPCYWTPLPFLMNAYVYIHRCWFTEAAETLTGIWKDIVSSEGL